MRASIKRVRYIKVGNLILREKLSARLLGHKRRQGYGFILRANDQVKMRKLKIIVCGMAAISTVRKEPWVKEMLKLATIRYLTLGYSPDVLLEKDVNLKRNIESFGRECALNFRFESVELRQLPHLLRFPLNVVLVNRLKMTGEKVFLCGLYQLKNGNLQYDISKCLDTSAQSRAFRYFVDHIYNNFHHLVHSNLKWWKSNGFWKRSAELIDIRMNDRYKFTKKKISISFYRLQLSTNFSLRWRTSRGRSKLSKME